MRWASPICRRLLRHLTRLALSRAELRAGMRIAMSRAMMAMTTRSSTRVKARLGKRWCCAIGRLSVKAPRGRDDVRGKICYSDEFAAAMQKFELQDIS